MSKNVPKKVIDDITGIALSPGKPVDCLGNGERGFECCCDECDHYLHCFPEFDSKTEKGIGLKIKLIFDERRKKDEELNYSSSSGY